MNELILTEQEAKFLGHILNEAWFLIDSDHLTEEGYQLYKSIEKKIKEQLNA